MPPRADYARAKRFIFANRNNVGNNELVVYIVSFLNDAAGAGNVLGCAAHPNGQPGVAVIQHPAIWLIAHEVGHVLGLRHVCEIPACVDAQRDSLMFPDVGWKNVPPDLSATEYTTMLNSPLTNPC